MANAKDEFLRLRNNTIDNLLCVTISLTLNRFEEGLEEKNIEAFLTTGFTKEELDEFLSLIDVEYDSGYGTQELEGMVWFKDGTWADRGEYDGSEWWNFNQYPQIPEELNRIDKVRDQKIESLL